MTDEEILELYGLHHVPVFNRERTKKYSFCNIGFTGVGCRRCKISGVCPKPSTTRFSLPKVSKSVVDDFVKNHPEFYI